MKEFKPVTIEQLNKENKYLDPTRDCMIKGIMLDEDNIDYIRKICYNKSIKDLTLLEKYCLLLITTDKDKARQICKGDIVMEKINKAIEKLSSSKKMIGLYNKELEDEKIKRTQIKEAYENGKDEGKKEGKEEGLKEGIEQEKISVAKNLLSETDDLEFIARITRLSIDKIKEIKLD